MLYSRTLCLDVNNTTAVLNINRAMRHHIRYNGSANTDIQKGALYSCMVSNEATNTVQVAVS